MKKSRKTALFAISLIIVLAASASFLAYQQNRHISFPKQLTMIRCLEFDGTTTDYTDAQTLDAVLNILQNSIFVKNNSAEPYIGNYTFEFYDDENVYHIGIARDQFLYNGDRYIVDENVNNEILKLLGK